MKKIAVVLSLMMVFGSLMLSGCGMDAVSKPSGTAVPTPTAVIHNLNQSITNSIMSPFFAFYFSFSDYLGRSSRIGAKNISALDAELSLSTPEYSASTGWWTLVSSSQDGTSYASLDFRLKAYTSEETQIISIENISQMAKALFKLRIESETSTEATILVCGNDDRPFIISNMIEGGTAEIDGIATYNDTIASSNQATSITFNHLSLGESLVPAEGSMPFSITGNYYTPTTGTITFMGTIERFDFSAPSEFSAQPYYFYLNEGYVTTEAPSL